MNSPIFRNFVISDDGKTSGIIVYIKPNNEIMKIKQKDLEIFKDKIKKERHQNILEIREVIKKYNQNAQIYLGGIPMIVDDMMTFIKNDIITFGLGVFIFIMFTLWYVFRKLIWIIIPISSCFFCCFHDWISWICRLEGYSYFIKLYSFNVNSNNGDEYSYEYSIFTTKQTVSKKK